MCSRFNTLASYNTVAPLGFTALTATAGRFKRCSAMRKPASCALQSWQTGGGEDKANAVRSLRTVQRQRQEQGIAVKVREGKPTQCRERDKLHAHTHAHTTHVHSIVSIAPTPSIVLTSSSSNSNLHADTLSSSIDHHHGGRSAGCKLPHPKTAPSGTWHDPSTPTVKPRTS